MATGRSIRKNYFYNMFYRVLILLVPIITMPYLSRILGSSNVGIYNYVLANTTYFSLIALFGSTSYGQREISFTQENRERLSSTFWSIFSLRVITSLLAIVLFLLFVFINDEYQTIYLANLLLIISVIFDISWFFQGLENFKLIVIRNTIIKLIATALIFILVNDENGLIIYVVINEGSTLLGNCSLWFFLKRYIKPFSWKYINLKRDFINSLKFFIPALAIQVYTVVDKTMLGYFATVQEVAYYSQAEKIAKLSITMISALGTVLVPRMGALISQGNIKDATQCYKKAVSFASMLAFPCMIGCFFVAQDFIPLFLGEEFIPAIPVFQILSGLCLILGIAYTIGSATLYPLKRESKYTIAVSSGAVINFIINILLIPRYGAIGAAVGTIFAEFCVTFLEVYFARDVFKPTILLKSLFHYFIPSLVMTAVLTICYNSIDSGLIRLIVLVVSGIASYGVSLLIMKDRILYYYLLNPIRQKLHLTK